MQKFKHVLFIECPPEAVFNVMSDLRNDRLWWKQVVSTKKISEGSIKPGSRFYQESRVLFVTIYSEIVVVKAQWPTLIQIKNDSAQMLYKATYRYAPCDNGCKVIFEAEVESRGILKFLLPLTNKIIERQLLYNFNTLKNLLESEAGKRFKTQLQPEHN